VTKITVILFCSGLKRAAITYVAQVFNRKLIGGKWQRLLWFYFVVV